MDKYIGRLLDGRYEILEVLGTGGMAVVYKARCHRLNRLVAIKILKDEYTQDEELRRRFQAESQAVAMLSHPNIVSVYDVSSSGGADHIIMELIDGITLKQYMEKKGVLNWKETLHFAMQIAKALEHAHGRGIVHRDIKPHNIMVLKNGSVKVADFGIAQVTNQSSTMTTEALGSVHYISPEQAKGGRVDNRSDIYSLGVVMYEMIAGRVPYDGDSPVAVAIQHINGGAMPPVMFNPNVPKGLEQIILRAMSLAPRDRYATAGAMLYDMDEFRKDPSKVFPEAGTKVDDATQVLPADLEQQAKNVAPQPEKTAPQRERASKSARPKQEERSRGTTLAIASCVLVGIIAIIIFVMVFPWDSLRNETEMVKVPSLVGQPYSGLPTYPGIKVEHYGHAYSDVYPKGQIMHQEPAAGQEVVAGTKVYIIESIGPEIKTMRDLSGEKKQDAIEHLKNLKLSLKIESRNQPSKDIKEGYVIRTEPAAGEPLNKGDTVILYISGKSTAVVPYVVGDSWSEAEQKLNSEGFDTIGRQDVASAAPAGTVVAQSEEAGNRIEVTTKIILSISTGTPPNPTRNDGESP
ncbi:MAG: Stk1 family PASTA domain-containing Ser/Thr kinase [Oscillospiraceae bacterium]|nr:Stk1 family PASTA domain-containing Ser/Thr kinase [Oscillospiraceae bacterium]